LHRAAADEITPEMRPVDALYVSPSGSPDMAYVTCVFVVMPEVACTCRLTVSLLLFVMRVLLLGFGIGRAAILVVHERGDHGRPGVTQ